MMKVCLLFSDRNFDDSVENGLESEHLVFDLELEEIFSAMARDNEIIHQSVRQVILSPLKQGNEIKYRQDALNDCVQNPDLVRSLFSVATDAIEQRKKMWWGLDSDFISSVFSSSINMLQIFADRLKKLRIQAENAEGKFKSPGFCHLFKLLREEFSDTYLGEVKKILKDLKDQDSFLISARLGERNQAVDFVLRRNKPGRKNWLKWKLAPSFTLMPRDDNGMKDLSNRRNKAIDKMTRTLRESTEHILKFFEQLRFELAFYVGCLNLHNQLITQGYSICFPEMFSKKEHGFECDGLYDTALVLLKKEGVVGNVINANGKKLVVITGANQGGKTTFLRSYGQARLMMQCGIFVAGKAFRASLLNGLFTHFKREEDASMKMGKLEEELARMSSIVEKLSPGSVVLFNESFSSTNEREGSEIGRQIVDALLDSQIEIVTVTHQFEFANDYYQKNRSDILHLRAERLEGGTRTFKILPGAPKPTSFGEDLMTTIA